MNPPQRLDENAPLLTPEQRQQLETALHNIGVVRKQNQKLVAAGLKPQVTEDELQQQERTINQMLSNLT